MNNNQKKLINLSVHESSDPNVIDPNHSKNNQSDANDRDVATSESLDNLDEPNVGNQQITIANLSAG